MTAQILLSLAALFQFGAAACCFAATRSGGHGTRSKRSFGWVCIVAGGLLLLGALGGSAPLSASPLYWPFVSLIVSIGMLGVTYFIRIDAAALKQEESLIAERAGQAKVIFDSQPAMMWLKDANNRILRVNKAAALSMQSTPEQIEGRQTEEFFPPEDAAKYLADDREVISSGSPMLGIVERYMNADGSESIIRSDKIPYLDAQGRFGGLVVFSQNITDFVKMEEKIRTDAERMKSIVEGTASAVGTDFFGSLCRHLAAGIGASIGVITEMKSDTEAQVLAFWERDRFGETFSFSVLGTPFERLSGEEVIFVESGANKLWPGDHWVNKRGIEAIVATALQNTHGEVVGQIAVLHDQPIEEEDGYSDTLKVFAARALGEIERMRSERSRSDLETRMQEAQRLESLGLLAGGIAHDFNNLLMGILGHASLGLMDVDDPDSITEHLSHIEKTSLRAAALTQQMLAYAGKGRMLSAAINLSQAVREMAQLQEVAMSRNCTLIYELAPDLPTIQADPAQIDQIILNLLTNASDAMPPTGGEIRMATRVRQVEEGKLFSPRSLEALPAGSYVSLEISDNGSGMDEETIDRIFDPFFTTKIKGRGLGLAAVLGIVRSHGGALELESKVGEGSSFRISFPIIAGQEGAKVAPAPKVAAAPWRSTGHVLVVDDDEVPRNVATQMLEQMGFTVTASSDGAEAVELWPSIKDRTSAVILDLTMPGMDGREVFYALRSISPEIPIVIVSGYDESESLDELHMEGLSGFLQKPFTVEAISKCLQGALETGKQA